MGPTSKGSKGRKDRAEGQWMGRREGRDLLVRRGEGKGGRKGEGEFSLPNIKKTNFAHEYSVR